MKPNGRDYKTDPVLKRLAESDHSTLILARRVQARGPHTEGFQGLEVYNEDSSSNQGPISEAGVSQVEPGDTEAVPALRTDSAPPSTKGQRELTATPAFGKDVENVALGELRSLEEDVEEDEEEDEDLTIK